MLVQISYVSRENDILSFHQAKELGLIYPLPPCPLIDHYRCPDTLFYLDADRELVNDYLEATT